MEPAYYRNFYSSSFAQPLPEAQRLETMNAKINTNELALYCTLADIDSHSRFCWQTGAGAGERAKYELAFTADCLCRHSRFPDAEQAQVVHCAALFRAAEWEVRVRMEVRRVAPEERLAEYAVCFNN